MKLRLFTWLAAVFMAACLCSCGKWYTYGGKPEDLVGSPNPPPVRITLLDLSEWEVLKPSLIDGKLCGRYRLLSPTGLARDTLFAKLGIPPDSLKIWREVPTDSIARLERWVIDPVKTSEFVLGVGIVAAAIVASSRDEHEEESETSGPGYSCPVVTSWSGEQWTREGMLYSGSFDSSLARTDHLILRAARADSDRVRLQIAGQLGETEHIDHISLLAVETACDRAVALTLAGQVVEHGRSHAPVAACDNFGRNVLAVLANEDGLSWESSLQARAPGAAPSDFVDVTFAWPAGATGAQLVVRACDTFFQAMLLRDFIAAHGESTSTWLASLAAPQGKERAKVLRILRNGGLAVSVWDGSAWSEQAVMISPGYQTSRTCAVPFSIASQTSDSLRVRLQCQPSTWLIDQVALAEIAGVGLAPFDLDLLTAAADGSDVREILAAADRRELTLEPQHDIELEFIAPTAVPGRAFAYVLQATGWYRLDVPSDGAPKRDLLARLERGPQEMARIVLDERARWLR